MDDLRFALRKLRKDARFTTAAVLTLALGIGPTTAILSVVKTTVFEPLPIRHADRFVCVGFRNKEGIWSPGVNPSALRELIQQTNLFASAAAYSADFLRLHGEDSDRPIHGVWVTPGFFALWKTRPFLGRTFTADESRPGKDNVFVISHALWLREFGGDRGIVGKTVSFRERVMTLVGVMPAYFSFPDAKC